MHFANAALLALLAGSGLSYAAAQGPGAFGEDCETLCNPPTCETGDDPNANGDVECIRVGDCVCPDDTFIERGPSTPFGFSFRRLAGAVHPPVMQRELLTTSGRAQSCNCEELPVCELGAVSRRSGNRECLRTSDINGETCFCPEGTFIAAPATQVSF